MALPRRILPGRSYLITRRCLLRAFRLRPSTETTATFKYCLALALEKTGVVLHAVCVMSNHHHIVVTDPRGVLPDFLRELHRACAKALNRMQGIAENLWACEPCSVVELATLDDVLAKVAYVVANPVAAGLVRSPDEWPGLLLWSPRAELVRKPKDYFSRHSPDTLTLRLRGPVAPHETAKRWSRRLRHAIARSVESARRAMRDAGRVFKGRAAVLATSIDDRAQSTESEIALRPVMAAADQSARAGLRQALRVFARAYRDALDRWRDGVRSVVFPPGTWWMRVHHMARCGPALHDAVLS